MTDPHQSLQTRLRIREAQIQEVADTNLAELEGGYDAPEDYDFFAGEEFLDETENL